MRTSAEKSKFIEALRETPFISYAAKRAGVSRSTIYRWLKDNRGFKDKTEKASGEGRKLFNDIAEMALLALIKKGNLRAIMFYLSHNNPRYIPKRSVYVEPIKELKPGEVCKTCGHEKIEPASREVFEAEVKKCAIDLGLIKEGKS